MGLVISIEWYLFTVSVALMDWFDTPSGFGSAD